LEEKRRVEEDVKNIKKDLAGKTKKQSRKNEKKKDKFMKRVQSENQLRG